MLRHMQTRYLATLNKLQELKAHVTFWEHSDNYKKALDAHREYIDFVRTLNNPRYLINAYISLGLYCEKMEDRLMAQDMFREAQNLMIQYGVDNKKIQTLNQKIDSLRWY